MAEITKITLDLSNGAKTTINPVELEPSFFRKCRKKFERFIQGKPVRERITEPNFDKEN